MQLLAHRKYAKPTFDSIFKRVFGTEKGKPILIDFLNTILAVKIESLTIENPELAKSVEKEKGSRLDILAKLGTGEFVDIEIQLQGKGILDRRSLYYGSKLIAGQNLKGKKYGDLKPVYVVLIADFEWDTQSKKMVQKYVLKNALSNKNLFEDREYFAIHFVEFKKVNESNTLPKSKLERWLLFFKTQNDKTLEELKMSDKHLAAAVTEIEVAKMTPAERRKYEAELAFEIDQASLIDEAQKIGEKRGEKRGEHQGKLKLFTNLALKRFPKLSTKVRAKIFMLSDKQLDHLALMILDYPNLKSFEEAINAIKVSEKGV